MTSYDLQVELATQFTTALKDEIENHIPNKLVMHDCDVDDLEMDTLQLLRQSKHGRRVRFSTIISVRNT